MFAYTWAHLKSKVVPLGYSRNAFLKKLRNPRASKPWRDRRALSAGRIEVTLRSDVRRGDAIDGGDDLPIHDCPHGLTGDSDTHTHTDNHSHNHSSDIVLGNLTTVGPLGLRCPHVHPHTSLDYHRPATLHTRITDGAHTAIPSSSPSPSATAANTWAVDAAAHTSLPGQEESTRSALVSQTTHASTLMAADESPEPAPLATLSVGDTLALDVMKVRTYGEEAVRSRHNNEQNESEEEEKSAVKLSGPVPIHLEHLTRTPREAAESIKVPRHINRLFHKIMGWSTELVELDKEAAGVCVPWSDGEHNNDMDNNNNSSSSSDAVTHNKEEEAGDAKTGEPAALRRRMRRLSDSVKYGVLLDSYEKDKFALAHRLQLAGSRLERKFLEWEGVHVLDQCPAAEVARVHRDKSAIVLNSPLSSFAVPVVGRDSCSGCGAHLQDRSADELGFVTNEDVARYVLQHEQWRRVRHDYATRMAELQAHWRKHGRRVGEEWLDFMTQEEFDAFYRRPAVRPFVCQRCHRLDAAHDAVGQHRRAGVSKHGSLGGSVWSAPDFRERLAALRERPAVVLLVVDVTDFPGSMVTDLPGLISMNHRVIIAVNKMDCVRNRSFAYRGSCRATAARLLSARHVTRWVQSIAHHRSFALPRHVVEAIVPVSARRGWNMEALLLAMESAANWNLQRPGKPLPIYVVGVTNVGKSSLINALAHHLYIPAPPHPQSRKVYYTHTHPTTGEESVRYRWYTPPNVNQAEMLDLPSRRDKSASRRLTVSTLPGTTVEVNAVRLVRRSSSTRRGGGGGGENDTNNAASHDLVLYDTPGILPHWHASSPLTLLQMRRVLMRAYRNPQCFLLCPGHTVFLGGLAAVDVVSGPSAGLLMMVYTSSKVRNAIVRTEYADVFWREQLGRALDPPGSLEQLLCQGDAVPLAAPRSSSMGGGGVVGHDSTRRRTARRGGLQTNGEAEKANTNTNNEETLQWPVGGGVAGEPGLRESRTYYWECFARHRRRPRADIYVCGLGWVSFCVSEPSDVVMRVRTLPGVVHGVREPLRYNDLGAFRHWPKLRRRSTARGLHDGEHDVDVESVGTVVRLTQTPLPVNTTTTHINHTNAASPAPVKSRGGGTRVTKDADVDTAAAAAGQSEKEKKEGSTLSDTVARLPRVPKSVHPRHAVSSSEPLESLITELQSSGNYM